MSIEKLSNILVTITVIEMMVAIGLGVTFAEVVKVARNLRLVAKAALANYVCVPAAAVGLLLLFNAHPMVAAGFLIAAVCPGAPYGPPFTAMAKGNVAVSVGLMVILAGSSAILAPLLLRVLLPLMAGNEPLKIDAVKMVITLLLSQLLPLCAGMAVRQWRPNLAARLQKPARLLSMLLNLSVFGIILVVQFHTLMEVRLRGLVGMFALVLASLAAGWLLGEPGTENRKAMALTTSVRNVAVSLVIATGSFPGTPAVTSALIYAVFQTIVLALLALVWGRRASAKSELAGGA
jgi:bile acid:Na+ symporter, BASS family